MKKRGAFFYILIVLALAAVGALAFMLAPGRQPATPAVVLPTAPVPDSSAQVTPEDAAGGRIIAVSPDTVQSVIASLRRIGSYSRTLSVRDVWSGGSRSRSIAVWERGDNLRLSIQSDSSSVLKELLIRGEEKWIWYSDSDAVYHGSVLPGDADAYQTLLTYEDVLDAPVEAILDAGYTEFAGKNCIFVRWRSGTLAYESECYIDPDTGLLMGERCYDDEKLIYSMDSSAPDVTTPDDAVFTLPRGAQG